MKDKIVVVSGGFDPIHSGHIAYFKAAMKLGNRLIVALNSDEWLIKKKGSFFMPFSERKNIIENLSMVDEVINFNDDEEGSCCLGLEKVKKLYPDSEIIFCNGGDRNDGNIPEMQVEGIVFKFGVGGNDKKNSSSWILKDHSFNKVEKIWGSYFDLFIDYRMKLKELIVEPGKGMSFQKHFYRNEIWFVSKGKCLINYSKSDPEKYKEIILHAEETFHVSVGSWHQITNPYDEPCHIIEIQYGEKTDETDIERLRYYNNQN